MYRHINQHIEALLDLLRENNHVQDYDNLMQAFGRADAAVNVEFKKQYAGFWVFQGVNNEWRESYFQLLQKIRNEPIPDLGQAVRRICREILGSRGGSQSVEFSFGTKLAHMVAPEMSPIYDANVRAFYFLPEPTGDMEARLDYCLHVYEALVREYKRILENHLLDESISSFREVLKPEEFTDVKIIDSLIWAFVAWARRDPAFLEGILQYE